MRRDGALLKIMSFQMGVFFIGFFVFLMLSSLYGLGACIYGIVVDRSFACFVLLFASSFCLTLSGFLFLSQAFLIYYGVKGTNWKFILTNVMFIVSYLGALSPFLLV